MNVTIGPVFDKYGGVSQNIFSIKRFSSHKVVEVLSTFVRIVLDKSILKIGLYKKLMNKVRMRIFTSGY